MFEDNEPILRLIEDIRKEQFMDKKISDTMLLIDTLDQQKSQQENYDYLKRLDEDIAFQRLVQKHNTLRTNQQDALLYYGQDYPGDQDYYYDEKLEVEFIKINKIIRNILSTTLKRLTSGEIDLFPE